MDPEDIDTRFGCQDTASFSHGNTLPLTGAPFAMNYLCVQTSRAQSPWWINRHDRSYVGLRLTHQPSPWMGDFQHFLFTGLAQTGTGAPWYSSTYDPDDAIMSPDMISVMDEGEQVMTEATNGVYGGAIRITSQNDCPVRLRILVPDSFKNVEAHGSNLAFAISNFTMCADPEFTMFVRLRSNSVFSVVPAAESNGNVAMEMVFLTSQATIYFATSFLGPEQAVINLNRINNSSFDAVKDYNRARWLEQFKQIEVTDHHRGRVSSFYHHLYRACLFPMRFYEKGEQNKLWHYSTIKGSIQPGRLYTNTGFWDTFRTQFPLFSLIMPRQYGLIFGRVPK